MSEFKIESLCGSISSESQTLGGHPRPIIFLVENDLLFKERRLLSVQAPGYWDGGGASPHLPGLGGEGGWGAQTHLPG